MKKVILMLVVFALGTLLVSCTAYGSANDNSTSTETTEKGTAELTTAQVTDTSYVETEDPFDHRDFEPGVILLGLKEPYKGDIRELFPQLGIAEVEDLYLKQYESFKDLPHIPKETIEDIKNRIGTTFTIKLTEPTKDAVRAGIALIKGNSIVDYAIPNYLVEPA